jgi:hypothetical protein
MAGFSFRRHSEFNLSEERLELLESLIQSRASFLSDP